LIFRAGIFGKWLGLHYMVGGLDGGKFVEGVERAVARLSDGAGGFVPFSGSVMRGRQSCPPSRRLNQTSTIRMERRLSKPIFDSFGAGLTRFYSVGVPKNLKM
jgi:hypothetical protein